jgi:hypothetical protein
LLISRDSGLTWQSAGPASLAAAPIRHLVLQTNSSSAVIATDDHVGRYDPARQHWQPLPEGLPAARIRLVADAQDIMLAATDQGLYKLDLNSGVTFPDDWPSAMELMDDFVNEPGIGQVQEAAIRLAEVQPEKIQHWRRQAHLRALLPSFDIDFDRDRDTFVTSIGSTTNPAFDRIVQADDPSRSLGFSLTWDLADLIWSSDQTSIDARSRLMVQLRDDILDEVTRHYYERRRLQIALMTEPPATPKERLDKELRIEELTALIDGLTGGWFSAQVRQAGH